MGKFRVVVDRDVFKKLKGFFPKPILASLWI